MLKNIIQFAKDLWAAYSEDNAFQKGAALAYYTVFSIAPIIIVIVAVAGIFYGPDAVSNRVFDALNGLIGDEEARQLQEVVKNSYQSGDGWLATVIGIGTLIFGATGVFNEMQNSLNAIWNIRAKPKSSVLDFLKTRVFSFGMVITLAFVLLVSLILNSLIMGFSEQITAQFSEITTVVVQLFNFALSLILTALLFAAIFVILPDAKVRWRTAYWGGIFTAVLFAIGKYAIGFYLSSSAVSTTFGAAGSVVVLLIWAYYTSQILFLGAEFTFVLARWRNEPIIPDEHAVKVKIKEIEVPA